MKSLNTVLAVVCLLVGCSKANHGGSLVDNALNAQNGSAASKTIATKPVATLESYSQMEPPASLGEDDGGAKQGAVAGFTAPCSAGGARYGRYCVYLGEPAQNCNEVCYYRGGYSRATELLSTAASNGQHCVWSLYNLAVYGGAKFGWPTILNVVSGNGGGCYLYKFAGYDVLYSDTSPVNPALNLINYGPNLNQRRVCSCNR